MPAAAAGASSSWWWWRLLPAAALEYASAHPFVVLTVAVVVAGLLRLDLCRRLPVRHLPGPKGCLTWPVIGHLPQLAMNNRAGTFPRWIREQAELHGFQTWSLWCPFMTEIHILDPKNMRHVFATNFSSYQHPLIRTEWFGESFGSGIFNSNGERWKQQRAYASHLFSAAQLRQRMQEVFAQHARKVRGILEALAPGEVIDIQRVMYSYTFDTFCEIAFGYPVDSLGGVAADREFQRCFDAVQARSCQRAVDVLWKAKRALGVAEERTMADDIRGIDAYIMRILDARRDGSIPVSPSDLLSIYEEHCASQGHRPTPRDLRDLVVTFVIAGRDTTASLLTWTWWELSRDRGARACVEADVRQHAEPAGMEYTQAVLQEVLRLHPSVPLDSKECVRDDTLPDGTAVRRGTHVAFHPCAITRSPQLYGPDPNAFRPARWLGDDGRCRKYDEFAYPCFSAGPRICLGRHMSALEAKVLLAELAGDLRVDVLPGFVPQLLSTVVLLTRNGMPCTVTRHGGSAPAA